MDNILSKLVKPSEISSEFEKLRRLVIKEGDKNITRATLSNVIFLIGEKSSSQASLQSMTASFEEVSQEIDYLSKNHPSRFFIVSIDETQKEAVETKVVSHPILNSSGQKLQSEELYISIRKDAVGRVPNLILSQLVPDIDVVLVEDENFGITPSEVKLRERILEISNIFITKKSKAAIDTLKLINPKCSFRSWVYPAINKWCSFVAEQFNSIQVLENLPNLKKIIINVPKSALNNNPSNIKNIDNYFNPAINCLTSWLIDCLDLVIEDFEIRESDIVLRCQPKANSILKNKIDIVFNYGSSYASNSNLDDLAFLESISFKMGEDELMTQVDCRYIKDLSVMEVSNESATHETSELKDQIKGDYCEFNVRRIAAHFYTPSESLLIAIRNQPMNCIF